MTKIRVPISSFNGRNCKKNTKPHPQINRHLTYLQILHFVEYWFVLWQGLSMKSKNHFQMTSTFIGNAPKATGADVPEVTGVSEVTEEDLLEEHVTGVDLPDVTGVDLPEVDLPEVTGVDLPDITGVDLPDVTGVDLLEVTDLPSFIRFDFWTGLSFSFARYHFRFLNVVFKSKNSKIK